MSKDAKKTRSKRAWLARHLRDQYVLRSRVDGYRARSAYKLLEIDDRERLLRPGMTVVDLGAAPGSWSQVAARRLGGAGRPRGRIVALDLLPMEPIEGVEFLRGDFREEEVAAALSGLLAGRAVDLVLSDMAPNLSGVAAADAAACALLNELTLDFALRHLGPDGALLLKCFQGSGYSQFVATCRRSFGVTRQIKPAASRDSSAEMYLLARRPRPAAGLTLGYKMTGRREAPDRIG